MRRIRVVTLIIFVLRAGQCLLYSQEQTIVPPGSFTGTYKLQYLSTTVTDLSGMVTSAERTAPRQTTIVKLNCTVQIAKITSSQTAFRLLRPELTYTVNTIPQSTLVQRVRAEMKRPALATYDFSGRVTSVHFSDSCSSDCTGILSAVISLLQIIRVDANSTDLSLVTENDRIGQVKVKYTYTASPRGERLTLLKTKLGYYGMQKRNRFRFADAREDLSLSGFQKCVFIKTEHMMEECSGRDTQSVKFGDIQVAQNTTEYDFKQVSTRRTLSIPEPELKNLTAVVNIPDVVDEETTKRAGFESVLGASSLQGILDTLDAFESGDTVAAQMLPNKLRAVVGLYDTAGDSILRRALQYHPRDSRLGLIADLLTRDGSENNQRRFLLLVNEYRDSTSLLSDFVTMFSNIERPTEKTLATLSTIAFEDTSSLVRSNAQLALGSLAGSVSLYDSLRADAIIYSVLQHKDIVGPGPLMYVLGNCGLRAALPALRKTYEETRGEDHYLALYSMRFIDDPLVDTLLAGELKFSDTSAQSVSLQTLVFREPSLIILKLLNEVCKPRANPGIRKETVGLLERWSRSSERNQSLVRSVIKVEAAASDIKQDLQKLLGK